MEPLKAVNLWEPRGGKERRKKMLELLTDVAYNHLVRRVPSEALSNLPSHIVLRGRTEI